MKLFDITRTIQDAPVYPGAKPTVIRQVWDMKNGDEYNYSLITTNSHAGTHCDAFSHFLEDSSVGIDKMPLTLYYGPCRVITVPFETTITRKTLEGRIEGAERLAIHGGGLSYLDRSAAEYIVECGIKAIVTDAWSISPLDNEAELHKIVLGAGIAIIETTTLDDVPDGEYTLCAFPLKLGGCDGAPVRAVLIEE